MLKLFFFKFLVVDGLFIIVWREIYFLIIIMYKFGFFVHCSTIETAAVEVLLSAVHTGKTIVY